MKANLENESTFWKWKHIPRIKANFENESIFREWRHILKMKAHFENESTFWKWKHSLKMKAHFENENKFWKWKHSFKIKAHFVIESTFRKCPNKSDFWNDRITHIKWLWLLVLLYAGNIFCFSAATVCTMPTYNKHSGWSNLSLAFLWVFIFCAHCVHQLFG